MPEVQAVHGLYEYIRDGGIVFCLVFFIVGGFKGWWVWGSQLTRERFLLEQQRDQLFQEREQWKRMALQSSAITDKAIDHATVIQKGVA